MHLHQVMKKNCDGFVLFCSETSKRKAFLSQESKEGVKRFQNKLGTTDVRFLSYNGICSLSQQAVYGPLGIVLFRGQQKIPHIFGEDRFSHSSLAVRSCLLSNSGERCNQKLQKNFSGFGGFFFYLNVVSRVSFSDVKGSAVLCAPS